MAKVDELLRYIDDPDDDSTLAYQVVDEIAASGDTSLLPRLTLMWTDKRRAGAILDELDAEGRPDLRHRVAHARELLDSGLI
ncbi:hypothetical protein AB0C74_18685 [Spirillospora sp. NPDC048832]